MRRVKEIESATEDQFARLWFYRDDRSGRPNNAEGRALIFKEWRARHGDDFPIEVPPTSDYELGRLEGRLETLRWVLGNEWGDLST